MGCHFDRREKSLLDPSRSLGMTGIGPSTSRLGPLREIIRAMVTLPRDNTRLQFTLEAQSPGSQARAATFQTLHGAVETPIFMPVGTQATVKAQTVESLQATGAHLLLANTYHLLLRPGAEVFKKFGGIHRFMNWPGPVLTDSGGFQIFSLPAIASHERSRRRTSAATSMARVICCRRSRASKCSKPSAAIS